MSTILERDNGYVFKRPFADASERMVALINLAGEMVGLDTALIGPSGGKVGSGFDVPSNRVQRSMQRAVDGRLAKGKEPERPAAVDAARRGAPVG